MTHETIRLLASDAYQDAITDRLEPHYEVVRRPPPPAGDLCLLEQRRLAEHQEVLASVTESQRPVFYPIVLLRQRTPSGDIELPDSGGSPLIDDVITLPIERTILLRRLKNLLTRRRYSKTLARHHATRHDRFQGLFDTIGDPAFVLDEDAEIVQMNDRFCQLVDARRETLFGKSIGSIIDMDLESGLFDPTESHTQTDANGVIAYGGGESTRYLQPSIRLFALDGQAHAVVILLDVTPLFEHLQRLKHRLAEGERVSSHDFE